MYTAVVDTVLKFKKKHFRSIQDTLNDIVIRFFSSNRKARGPFEFGAGKTAELGAHVGHGNVHADKVLQRLLHCKL